MEIARRTPGDVYLSDGAFSAALQDLRRFDDAHDLRIGIVYAFDSRTHMLPYWYADKRMAPCSVRTLGEVLDAGGFRNVRIILQQWTPNFSPSRAELAGGPLDILLVSAMQVHAEPAYALIRDAHHMGELRPLILAGGPKAVYEPTDFFDLGPEPGIGADCVVTGEAYVLLDLLRTLFGQRRDGESPRSTFQRVRGTGELNDTAGLVYLPSHPAPDRPYAINTGVQRLLRDLDEMPMPDAGYRMIESPHRRRTLNAKPCSPEKVGKLSMISSVISTQGCKFNCPYCPIPAVNQRTWRHKSPRRLAAEIKSIHENFGIREFFSTDDNFFNQRETVIALMGELAATQTRGEPLARHIRFFTEATQFDVYKNRDILPLCREGGMEAIWFGIEDITGQLVNKGQSEGKTAELFRSLRALGIEPMAMVIHSDEQPLRSAPGDLSGLINQAKYLFDVGAVSYQCTYLGPAIGTRNIEGAVKAGTLYQSVGGDPIPQAFQDGNHVVASRHKAPWKRQINVLRAYWAFYNPLNALRTFLSSRRDPTARKRLMFQVIGQIGLVMTVPRLLGWARKLKRGPIAKYQGLQRARIPMVDAAGGHEVFWALEQIPSPYLPQNKTVRPTIPAPSPKPIDLAVSLATVASV